MTTDVKSNKKTIISTKIENIPTSSITPKWWFEISYHIELYINMFVYMHVDMLINA